jgi:LCP family protein required for cell wall assembly
VLQRLAPTGFRSAFAAAFLSFLFPGLGQAYAGLTKRALAFAALPAALLVILVLLAVAPGGRTHLLASLASPTVLLVVLALDLGFLFYRAVAVVDAYRAADAATDGEHSPTRRLIPTEPARILSLAGLAAILLVLAGGHMAVARVDLLAYDLVTGITSSRPSLPGVVGGPASGSPGATGSAGGSPGQASPGSSESAGTPRPTLSPLQTATPTSTPVATVTPQTTDAPPWDGRERLNVLLVGTDTQPEGNPNHFLTDTLILASVDPETKSVAMFSIPRDTVRVPIPASWPAYRAYGGVYPGKINTIWWRARESPDLFPGEESERGYIAIKGAVGELLGLRVHYFVEVDFDGFKTVVDTVGGVTVDVQVPVSDDKYPSSDGRGALNLYIPPGIQHMDGAEALAYARARTKTNDFDRAARQQRLVRALRERVDLASLLVPGHLEAIVGALKEAIRTDVPAEMLPRLITLGQEIDLTRARSLVFSPPEFAAECLECYSITPYVSAIREAVQKALTPDPAAEASREKLASEAAIVWVADGGSGAERATSTAAYLASVGLDASVAAAASAPLASPATIATLTVYNGAEWRLPETIALLKRAFGGEPIMTSDPNISADIVITLGSQAPVLAPPA